MAKLLYGSINFDELLAQIRTGTINTEIVTRKNGETFRSVSLNVKRLCVGVAQLITKLQNINKYEY